MEWEQYKSSTCEFGGKGDAGSHSKSLKAMEGLEGF